MKGTARPFSNEEESYTYPQPQRHRIIPFEISDEPSIQNSSSKYRYQSISEEEEENHHDDDAGLDDGYILGPNYDDDFPLQQPPPDNIGTFVLEDADSFDRKRKMSYPPAFPKKSDHDLPPMRICMYFTAFLLIVCLFYAVATLTQSFTCQGAPYLYITHKGSKNILKFSRDGCLIHEKVLWGVAHEDADLRGMAIGTYQGQQALYVADSSAGESGVLLYGKCFESTSLRPFLDRVVYYHSNRGADHAYGIAIDEITGNIYASFQDTDVILRFEAELFLPLPNEHGLQPLFLEKKKDNKTASTKSKNNDNAKASTARYVLRSRRLAKTDEISDKTNTSAPSLEYFMRPLNDSELAKLHVADPQEEKEEEDEEQEIAKGLHPVKKIKDKLSHNKAGQASPTHHHSQHGRPATAAGAHHMLHHHSTNSKTATTNNPYGRTGKVGRDTEDHRHHRRNLLDNAEESEGTDTNVPLNNAVDGDKNSVDNTADHNTAENNDNSSGSSGSEEGDNAQNLTNSSSNKHNKTMTEYSFYDGTFVQFGKPGFHGEKERGVRSIIWTKNFTELWIANEDLDSIIIVNRTGNLIGKVAVGKPIGLHYSNTTQAGSWVFVGSKGEKTGQVYAIDVYTRNIAATFKYIGMKHPAGITSYEDVLFVGDQTRNNVVTFNITTGRVIKLIIPAKRIDGQIEQLTMSDC